MNTLIIGAGGVAQAAVHKCALNNDIFGDIIIASRTGSKCKEIINGIKKKNNIKDPSHDISWVEHDAMNIEATVELIKKFNVDLVLNLGSAFLNMSVLDACILAGVDYIDTAVHEQPDRVAAICEPYPWYDNYEWKRRDVCKQKRINAILGAGFDPGLVNAYTRSFYDYYDHLYSIDILDVNAGKHGKYFATNFDLEINFREFVGSAGAWVSKEWVNYPMFSKFQTYNFPVIGEQKVYLTGHDELHSLSINLDIPTIRFWMGFSEHYINVFNVLKNLGLLSEKPVRTSEGVEVIPLKVVKACLPDPKSLAPNYTGKTCIGVLANGMKDGKFEKNFMYNICDHKECYEETDSQAISYTAAIPAVAAGILLKEKIWNPNGMANIEELDPIPFICKSADLGLKTESKLEL